MFKLTTRLSLTLLVTIGLLLGMSLGTGAAPPENGFYFGFGIGEAQLNNDAYLYSAEANIRQPELNVQESSSWEGTAYSIFVGYNLLSKDVKFFDQDLAWRIGVEAGYKDLGKYTVNVHYLDPDSGVTGYRSVKESAVDVLLTSAIYWDNGFNLFGKIGIARFNGVYEQEGLRSPRIPEYSPAKETYNYTVYRPEIAVGLGYLIGERWNLYLQYAIITGDVPSNRSDRFGDSIIEMPGTLYRADAVNLGVIYSF